MTGRPGPTAEDAAAKTGSKWLTRRNADVLVFGEVLPSKSGALNLHFLASDRVGHVGQSSPRQSGCASDQPASGRSLH